MATPSASVSSSSTSRWEKLGETGSAFNGLSRGTRGRGRGGNRGGGRGGPNRGANARTSKPNNEHNGTSKIEPPLSSPTPATTSVTEKLNPPTPSTSTSNFKTKPPSRRASRAAPSPLITQVNIADIPPSPASAKGSNRRRRSHASKQNSTVPSKINPPAHDDNLHRPSKARLGPVPHTAPIKDAPPHLNQKLDIRNDIDALVERVRAVAMDTRPATPGSHIDWAGDEDDSLPDLDDWGITTSSFTASKASDAISPIIVDGLRPLPDIIVPPSPLKQVVPVPSSPSPRSPRSPEKGTGPAKAKRSSVNQEDAFVGSPSTPMTKDSRAAVNVESKEHISTLCAPKEINDSQNNATNQRQFHPSLPAKPVSRPFPHLKSRNEVTPMRNAPFVGSPVEPTDASPEEGKSSQDGTKPFPSAPAILEEKHESPGVSNANPLVLNKDINVKINETGPKVDVSATASVVSESLSIKGAADTAKDASHKDDFTDLHGLSASIHAPKAMSDAMSAPPTVSSYSEVSLHGHGPHMNNRSHNSSKSSSFAKPQFNEHNARFTRSGQSPRERPQGSFNSHFRTKSSPTSATGQSRAHTNRPVITGDAISRLARTIGPIGKPKPSVSVSPKPQTVAPSAAD